jgi:hypothetical protein
VEKSYKLFGSTIKKLSFSIISLKMVVNHLSISTNLKKQKTENQKHESKVVQEKEQLLQ